MTCSCYFVGGAEVLVHLDHKVLQTADCLFSLRSNGIPMGEPVLQACHPDVVVAALAADLLYKDTEPSDGLDNIACFAYPPSKRATNAKHSY
jgi:hypothetical protein